MYNSFCAHQIQSSGLFLVVLLIPDAPLRFWLAVQDLKRRPLQEVSARAQEIWQEFLAEGAPSSINLDSHSYERTSQNLKDPGRYSYEDAQVGYRAKSLMSVRFHL